MDFITELPVTSDGFSSVLVVVDRFSKMVHLFALGDDTTAAQIAKVFFDGVVKLHGIP